jgi:hypothetical protein
MLKVLTFANIVPSDFFRGDFCFYKASLLKFFGGQRNSYDELQWPRSVQKYIFIHLLLCNRWKDRFKEIEQLIQFECEWYSEKCDLFFYAVTNCGRIKFSYSFLHSSQFVMSCFLIS